MHHAFPCNSIPKARAFYGGVLGCKEGRSTDIWCDFNFFGHQVVAHKVSDTYRGDSKEMKNPVDGHGVPVPHFGIVMEWNAFNRLVERIKKAKVKFEIAPYTRFAGLPGEQRTMFFKDPSGNALEFKTFKNIG